MISSHPAAELFPFMSDEELGELAADIRAHGLLEPIVLLDGLVLDGRNRLRACEAAGVEPRFVEWDGSGDPALWVISKNLKRRHLDTSQRGMVAAKLLDYYAAEARERHREGSRIGGGGGKASATLREPFETVGKASAAAGAAFNVSPRTVEHAATVIERGVPELVAAVERGAVAVSTAAVLTELPKPEQALLVAKSESEILAAAKEIRARRTEERRSERIEKIAEIATGNVALAGGGGASSYPVICADPPWRYEHAESESRAIENQYPTMSLEEICALPVSEIATEDAVLYLWVTSPKLAEGMKVIEAWGFTYRTSMVWVKDRIGMGYWARQRHELILIATRGSPPTPPPAVRPDSVLESARVEHSAKPAAFYEMIERLYPAWPRLEMFCRSPRPGWSVWGNQSGGEK